MHATSTQRAEGSPTITRPPRLGGLFRRLSRMTGGLALPLAGKGWNTIFAVVEHRGRRTGRAYFTPVAARRVEGGFVIALAFGAHVDGHRNLLAADGGTLRWKGTTYRIGTPRPMAADTALPAFDLVQRLGLRAAGIDRYVFVPDAPTPDA
jgi:deazaflavin-dependent oxidoreductase (nitroreductase family)